MIIKKGNTVYLGFALTDSDGNVISNLSDATDVVFNLKATRIGTSLITKNKVSGVTINVNKAGVATTGSIQVILSASETDALTAGNDYFIAVEIQWTDNTQEVFLTENGTILETVKIKQDVVNAS